MRCASLLALVCVATAAKLQGYSAGGNTGLGITLGQVHGGAGHRGVGGGSVVPAIFVGSGVIPESAFGGVTGGVLSGEYSAPSVGVAPAAIGGFGTGVTTGFDAGVAGVFDAGFSGGFDSDAVAGEYIPPIAGPDAAPVAVLPAPGNTYITPRN
ncbi:glycine-rich cell wall structural protein 1-like [Penaeus monodon]|uniref:glycine-rich cell wall structural protein 1-like n=1 Tax=Penaeus monodon TaxID=6687 RepID=UPI0018A6E303|nr:glycine-rich cell wall structural protein 1-like [Penaeus monodon]